MKATLRCVDLSWPVRPDMPLFPGDPPVQYRRMGSLDTHGYLSHLVSLPAHSGTHVDAPGHALAGGAMLADLPLERFRGPGVLLDVRDRKTPAVEAGDLAPHLDALRAGRPAFVLLRTGDEERWGREEYFTHGAHLTREAAELLAGLAGLGGVGLDAGSADALEAVDLPAHRVLARAGLVIVENLRGLAQLPQDGFEFLCLPVLGLDGSPVRAAALLGGMDGSGEAA